MSETTLHHREQQLQSARKQTPWREFVIEICSRLPLVYHKNHGSISRYPETERSPHIVSVDDFDVANMQAIQGQYTGDFFGDFMTFFRESYFPVMMHLSPCENGAYADMIHTTKNAYLSSEVVLGCENVLYSNVVKEGSRNVFDSMVVFDHSENIYGSTFVMKSSNVFFSRMIVNSYAIYSSSNLVGCQYCIDCHDLENQSYCIANQQVTKEEFEQYRLNRYQPHMAEQRAHNIACTAVQGERNFQGVDLVDAYGTFNIKDGKNILFHGGKDPSEHVYDMLRGGRSTHMYGCLDSGKFNEHVYLSFFVIASQHIFHSIFLENCSYCLGCIGLQNKSYCIFNTQYTKEEWYQKVNEIFGKMEADGTLGQFFPGRMNPFYFNDTAAYLIDDTFTKEEVTAKGYMRRDEPIAVDVPEWMDVVEVKDLGDYEGYDERHQRTIDPSILKKVIRDEQGNVYRIIKMEYDFLVKHRLPIPRQHWLERLKKHFRIA